MSLQLKLLILKRKKMTLQYREVVRDCKLILFFYFNLIEVVTLETLITIRIIIEIIFYIAHLL